MVKMIFKVRCYDSNGVVSVHFEKTLHAAKSYVAAQKAKNPENNYKIIPIKLK